MLSYPIGYTLHLISLAERLGLQSDCFIVRKVIDGGMGTCYQICDSNGKPYALKSIHSDLLIGEGSDESIQRYISEIKLWLTFSSCNGVAEALDIVRLNEIPCVVSTWMEGGDMREEMNISDRSLFYPTMDRIITTLKWVYDNYSVIHRDLKPGNILLDKDHNPYVADWGLAKILYLRDNKTNRADNDNSLLNPAITQTGVGMGTAAYASPEQMLGLPNIDCRSDIYSLGCMMYQWETGRLPYEGRTWPEIAKAKITTKPKKIGGLFHSTNLKASHIIMKCLALKPENRYQSYDVLLEDLHKSAVKVVPDFKPFIIKQRYTPITVGFNEFEKRLKNNDIGIVGNKGFGIASSEDVSPYLKEAASLSALGELKKSNDIYRKLFIPDLFRSYPDFGYNQYIACNYADNLNGLGRFNDAISVLLTISSAKTLPSEYYVNLSNSYIGTSDFHKAKDVSSIGLIKFPNDTALLGNHTIALTQLGDFNAALESANKRLKIETNIHSLCEAASVHYGIGERSKNIDFPKAIESYKQSLRLYRTALKINPRYPMALYNVSLLLFKMKRYTDAIQWGNSISKLENGTSELNAVNMAKCLLWTSNFEKGLKFCDDCLKLYPKSIGLQRVRSEILVDGYVIDNYSKEGLPIIEKSSLEFFTNIVKDQVNSKASDIVYLAKLHFWMQDDEDTQYGFDLLNQGKSLYPSDWRFSFYISSMSRKYNDITTALTDAKLSNQLAPWREKTCILLADALKASGSTTESEKMRHEYEKIKALKAKLYYSCKGI